MLMQQKNKMTKLATTTVFTMVLGSADVQMTHSCSDPVRGLIGIRGVAF